MEVQRKMKNKTLSICSKLTLLEPIIKSIASPIKIGIKSVATTFIKAKIKITKMKNRYPFK